MRRYNFKAGNYTIDITVENRNSREDARLVRLTVNVKTRKELERLVQHSIDTLQALDYNNMHVKSYGWTLDESKEVTK